MTAPPLSQQTVPVKDAAAGRKRRRRAPAGGAADDCFTCSKRNVKCDRRRPYCSQCLEIGNECSGYKTQLTWGVGVASRGKLRGLSLPIAKAPPVSREPKKSPVARGRANSTAAVMAARWVEQDEAQRHRGPIDIPSVAHSVATHASSYPGPGYDYLSMSHSENSTATASQHGWGNLHYSGGLVPSPDATSKYSKFPLPLITDGLSSSVDSVSDVDYLSPLSQTYSRDEMPFGSGSSVLYDGYGRGQHSPVSQSPPSGLVLDSARVPTSCPGLVYAASEHSSSINSHLDAFDTHLSHKLMRECDSFSVPQIDAYNPSCSPAAHSWTSSSHPREDELQSPQSEQASNRWPTTFPETERLRVSPDLVARMPFFMDYYKNTIAPSMVYIDGPHNPFRDHILQLAVHSQSLQHAICALSACNLRMKRKLSLGQDTQELFEKLTLEKNAIDSLGDRQPDDPSLAEEFQHRNLAVNLLNEQLNDPLKSTYDSVLATILLLCHYRMVESGVAKFHTQFAGVKKILSMRTEQFGPSRGSAWMEALFTYFDAISASINDREAQLAPTVDDGLPLLPLGAENLVGCDRALFKTISKLGRLNLLSQHRPVQNVTASPQPSADTSPCQRMVGSPLSRPYSAGITGVGSVHMQQNPRSQQQLGAMYAMPAHRFDGNGFGSTLDDDEILASAMSTSAAFDDSRSLFWREWKEARLALQNWQFEAVAVATSLPGSPSPSRVRDLESVSEAFRYAALLYTERLAGPSTPSSHTDFQNLVSQVVYYATSLDAGSTAEKFLLWPLFVAGSECVNELQQNIVRAKCRDIMNRSGYMNNLSALDILEKLWAGEFNAATPDLRHRSGPAKMAGCRGPLNWAKCFGGPGAEAEWIMF
ncbi:Zn(2)-C6 fungal-type DNA-binding domain protein [Metarhizium album ARSEF 1941]|uniref:Zn(2)-C6 fungal-type DNA-binding domain protein n=1 Tax=Metarhizium album (strain ARSEF 1941) TaxID=1081103 RepID=A0A0B2X4H1_METAS|nr:Zn(2)-C6 fungal-type DNA-binding domain protein [Metarhizium album ARSEF 1941]KHO00320.1 Zn(2)-C6 fungal-type DNA-binding domain protein [Metarhizium album ARSEF 1941]